MASQPWAALLPGIPVTSKDRKEDCWLFRWGSFWESFGDLDFHRRYRSTHGSPVCFLDVELGPSGGQSPQCIEPFRRTKVQAPSHHAFVLARFREQFLRPIGTLSGQEMPKRGKFDRVCELQQLCGLPNPMPPIRDSLRLRTWWKELPEFQLGVESMNWLNRHHRRSHS
jgi:hypothetical protein